MNIGIIVYSQTGNTHGVAQKLQEKLAAAGHNVNLERITVSGEVSPGSKDFQITNVPQVDQYDAIIFGAPVQAFSLTPVMTTYLNQLSSLRDKKVACYVTKQLPFHWTGGNRAVARMKKLCEIKDAKVDGTGIVIWSKAVREQNISECIERLSTLFALEG